MSSINRRELSRLILSASIAGTAPVAASRALAAEWPTRPVTLIIPYPPGGVSDPEARLVANALSGALGQPFVPQNKPGAAGEIATEFVAHAAPDGYTFLFATSAQTTILPLIRRVNFTLKQLIPVSAFAEGPMVLGISSSLPAKTLKEFISLVDASPGKYSYASGGTGSVAHLAGAEFVSRLKLNMIHVPYHGGGPAVVDLMAGRVAMYFGNAGEMIPRLEDRRIRLIGVSSERRMQQLPNVPAINERLPGFKIVAWRGFMAPAGTPQPIIERVANLIQRTSKDPRVISTIRNLGDEMLTTTPTQLAELIAGEQKIYADAVAAAGIKTQ